MGETLKLQSTEQQASKQDGIDIIVVTEENLSTAKETKQNEQCTNNYSGAEVVACNEIDKILKSEFVNGSTLEEKSTPQIECSSNAQIDSYLPKEIKSANEGGGIYDVSSVSVGTGSQCIIVNAEVHDY
jgi:hypothetical protein